MRRLILSFLLLAGFAVAVAAQQEQPRPDRRGTHVTQLGVGGVNVLDTYLSPLEYSGPQGHYLNLVQRPTRWMRSRLSLQSLFHVEGSYIHNKPNKANEMQGALSYDVACHYNWHSQPHLHIMAGPQLGGMLGAVYNTRNGNNPVQALANVHLSASAVADYTFSLWRRQFVVTDQLDVPLVGAMFSPNYGQSYYEIFSEGETDHNVCMTSPFNAPSLRNMLSLDFILFRQTFRLTYLMDIRQSHVNELKHHTYSHAALIGWVKRY